MVMMGMEFFNKYNKIFDFWYVVLELLLLEGGEGIDYKLNIYLYCY